MGVLRKAIACAIMAVALFCIVPGLAMADESASVRLAIGTRDAVPCVDKVISTAWGSYEGCTQWLGMNAEVSGAAGEDKLTFFLTASADGTEADLAAEGLSCTCTVADLPERKASVYNAREKGPGFLVSDLPAGRYWLGCKLVSGGVASYASAPRSFTVYASLSGFAEAALERTLACSRYSHLISEDGDGVLTVALGSSGDYGDDWEAWMLPALVSGGCGPLFASLDSSTYLASVGKMLDRTFSGELSDLTLKDYFRYVTALCAVGEDPRDFHGYNLVAKMMEKADAQGIVERAKSTDPLFLSYFLLACKIACTTSDEGFTVDDEAACYEGLLSWYERTVGTGSVDNYMASDNYAMSMLPMCFPVGDTALQERVDAAKAQMLDAYAVRYQYGNGAISYGQPAADNGGFAQPNSNSSAVLVNTLVLMGLGADDLAGARWQKPYGSLMSSWMTQMNDDGWMTYAGNPANNDMATYQTLGALVDLHNGKSCFAIASERYLDAHPECAAARVEDLIAALPAAPGLDDEGAVVGARAAYARLTAAQQALVSAAGLSALQSAEAAIAEAKAAAAGEKTKYRQLSGTAYLSVSHDGRFVEADGYASGRVLAHVPIDLSEVSKVDLDDYGLGHLKLEAPADAGCEYETTLLQLFVYACELFHAEGYQGMEVTGNAGSVYLKRFFGMDENFLYYVNGAYPLASAGWGATCESIALSDGDCIDVAHFADWNFHTDPKGGLHYLTLDGNVAYELTAHVGEAVGLGYVLAHANIGGSYATTLAEEGGTLRYARELYADDAASVEMVAGVSFSLTFDEVGDYFLWTDGALGQGTGKIASAPAVAIVHVVEAGKPDPDDPTHGDPGSDDPKPNEQAGSQGSEGAAAPVAPAVKKANPMKVTAKTVKIKAAKLKKTRTVKALAVKGAQGKVSFKLVKIKAKKKLAKQAEKKIKVVANGKVKLKRGLKKGTYRVVVRVSAAGNGSYKPSSKTVTVKLVVK